MQQLARNVTQADTSFLCGCRYLLRDRDAKVCAAFDGILSTVGIKAMLIAAAEPEFECAL
jgi:hypothetical protein